MCVYIACSTKGRPCTLFDFDKMITRKIIRAPLLWCLHRNTISCSNWDIIGDLAARTFAVEAICIH